MPNARPLALALIASLLTIVGYVWFRFNRIAYGIAAVVALIHDVLITVGPIAVSYWLARKAWMPEHTRFVWLAWIVVGFALTYGNYLNSLTRA